LAKRIEGHAKGMVVPATLFEEFGFNYIGPIDGHDLDSLVPTLENIRQLSGPQFSHVVTKKGQGYSLAERDPVTYHGPGSSIPKWASCPQVLLLKRPLHKFSATGFVTWGKKMSD
jgi:1-deoxy-D-xylulose-5-phosphate synthase